MNDYLVTFASETGLRFTKVFQARTALKAASAAGAAYGEEFDVESVQPIFAGSGL